MRQRGLLVTDTDLPAASLARAIALRFAARSERYREFFQEHEAWRRNAHVIAAQLVIDRVIAEIYATHAFPKEDADDTD